MLKDHISLGEEPKRVGFGNFGVIYSLGPTKVIKLGMNKADLEKEYENLKNLADSGAVPKVYGLFELSNKKFGLVLERGSKNLLEAMENGEVSDQQLEKAADDMSKLCDVLKEKGIEYTDIKPSNLLIMNDGSIKAIDIGTSGAGTLGYNVGGCGRKMAISLMEAKLGQGQIFNFNKVNGKTNISVPYEKYRSRLFYKEIKGNNADVSSIQNLSDLLSKLGSDRDKLFDSLLSKDPAHEKLVQDFRDDENLEKLREMFSEDWFRGGQNEEDSNIQAWQKAWADEQKRVFEDIVNDKENNFPLALKNKLLELYVKG
jgi:serine/threonine protein kinase